MKHVANFLLASSIALGLAPAAVAQPPMGWPAPMMHLRALGLTEAQHDEVFRIFHEQAPALHEQMKQARHAREELSKLARAERFDTERVRELAAAEAKALAELSVLRAQAMHRVRAILTPEQRAKLDERHPR